MLTPSSYEQQGSPLVHGRYSKPGEAGKGKQASAVPVTAIRQFYKLAEDAINPAQISADAAAPPAASASEMAVPAEPSDVNSQKNLIASNEAAINYTKRDAKKDPVSDVAQVVNETPMQDPVLNKVLDNAGEAGVKTSAARSMAKDTIKVAAARALLFKLAEEVNGEKKVTNGKKEKEAQLGGNVPTPTVSQPAFSG
jgi:hypothetical protein